MYKVPSPEEALVIQREADKHVVYIRIRELLKLLGLKNVTRVFMESCDKRLLVSYSGPYPLHYVSYASLLEASKDIIDKILVNGSVDFDMTREPESFSVPLLVEEKL